MELLATDLDRLAFLLEADASCYLDDLISQGAELVTEELPPDERPKYITNYIGSKQKLVDWSWKHTPEGVASVLDAFCGSAVVVLLDGRAGGHGPALDLMLRKVSVSYPQRYTSSSEPRFLNTEKIPARREFRQ